MKIRGWQRNHHGGGEEIPQKKKKNIKQSKQERNELIGVITGWRSVLNAERRERDEERRRGEEWGG